MERTPLRYLAWLVGVIGLGVLALMPLGNIAAVVFVIATMLGAVPLIAQAGRAVSERRPDVSLAALSAAAIWLALGQTMLAWAAILVGLGVTLAAAAVRHALRARLGRAMELQPPVVRVVRTSREELVAYGAVHPGDRVVVQQGERVPVDGELISATAKVRAAFGEREERLAAGDTVTSGDVAMTQLVVEARHVGREATWSIVATLIDRLAATLPRGLMQLERGLLLVQGVWIALTLIVVAFVGRTTDDRVLLAWLCVGGAWWLGSLVARGVLAAWTVRLLRRGLLPKTWSVVERTRRLGAVVFHKTGTLAAGTPMLVDVKPATDAVARDDLLRLVAALERDIDHPIAHSIRRAAVAGRLSPPHAADVVLHPSAGVTGTISGERFMVGTEHFVASHQAELPPELARFAARHREQGATIVFVAKPGKTLGLLVFAEVPRPSASALIRDLKLVGLTPMLISGDEALPTRAAAAAAGIAADEVFAPLAPTAKAALVREHRVQGVVVVADPTADRVTLAEASLGIGFLGSGPKLTDPSSQVLIRSDDLSLVGEFLGYVRRVRLLPWFALAGDAAVVAALTTGVLLARSL